MTDKYDHDYIPLEDHDEPSAWIFVHTERTYPGVTIVEGVDPTNPTSAVTLDEDEFRAAIGTYGRVKTEQDDNE